MQTRCRLGATSTGRLMEISRQSQEAGPNSQQIQNTGQMVIITPDAAVEIAKALKAMTAVEAFTADAIEIGSERIGRFDEKVVHEFSERGLLEAFRDPAFQTLFRKAQLHAAATEEDTDHELLTKLLAERAQHKSKPMHMVVSRAVEVVEQIDDDALVGMTLIWLVTGIVPSSGDPKQGLGVLDSLASKFCEGEPPGGSGWLQRLDLLNCINYSPSSMQSMLKWHQILANIRPGYVCAGISPDTKDDLSFRLNGVLLGLSNMIVDHVFRSGFYRLNVGKSEEAMKAFEGQLALMRAVRSNPQAVQQLIANEVIPDGDNLGDTEALRALLGEAQVDTVNAEASEAMTKYVEANCPALQRLRAWWDALPGTIQVTPLGQAMAYSNAKRYDELAGLPPLPEILAAN